MAGSTAPTPGPTGSVRVRTGVEEDADALYRLSLRAIRTSAAEHYTEQQLAAWAARRSVEGHRRMVESTRSFVAVDGELVVGFATLALRPGDGLEAGEVDQLFVDPSHGGRGVAAQLLTAVDRAARAADLPGLVTHASWRAVPVFAAAGFARVIVESVDLDGEVLTRVLMRKALGTSGL